MSKQIEELKLEAKLADLQQGTGQKISLDDIFRSIKTNIDISTIKINEGGDEQKSYTEISMVIGLFSGILIYFFIFMFGSQVMRGVIEEKTNRIIEVIISSVKPFQLMMGKIVGVALVGLTQFLLWVVLTFIIITAVVTPLTSKTSGSTGSALTEQVLKSNAANISPDKAADIIKSTEEQEGVNEVLDALNSINFPVMIGAFIFYFPLWIPDVCRIVCGYRRGC